MRYLFSLMLLTIFPLQADVYKCTANGSTTFSDQPCSDNAERIEIKTTPPATVDIETQQEITQEFEEESWISEIKALNQENDDLVLEINRIQKQSETELEALREKTYELDDGRMATSDPTVFGDMNQVIADTKQKTEALKERIRVNEDRLETLYQQGLAEEKP
ncbi:DUF4124 domain-containing protein [Methylophaga thiooxydans]|uniref:DUF4124 domain-containing protein n=1 Tax=Methylophaga thiooxydans TaxID=392484 RepID=UPI002357C948|nr:DUF4124 domain-containing protein [Methylophaga thiooxydans]